MQFTVSQIGGRGVRGTGISQNSPVQPTKHSQVKFAPKSSAKHVPLLQLINSQNVGEGLGVWVGPMLSIKEGDGIGMLQNIPVHPGKHSHTARSSPTSMQSPFVQSISHTEMLAVGDGVGSIVVRDGTTAQN